MKHPEFVVVVLTIAAVFFIAVFVSGDANTKIKLTFDYGLLTILFLFAFLILATIASGKIDIGALLSENGGAASMSRFQLLIFTFVIAISFFLVVVHTNDLPNVLGSVLALLGISADTYGISKGIQASSGQTKAVSPQDVPNVGVTVAPVPPIPSNANPQSATDRWGFPPQPTLVLHLRASDRSDEQETTYHQPIRIPLQ